MRKNLLAAALFLTLLSTGTAAEEIVKDTFQDQADGHLLSDLVNWKFWSGWIKPEDGKITTENGNKFLRFHGDFFARNQFTLLDKLTFRYKIRAAGTDDEVGGLDLRSADGKQRYDILCAFKRGGVSVAKDSAGQRDILGKKDEVLNGGFQSMEVVIEHLGSSVKFTISANGSKVIEKEDADALPFLKESFSVGFFTYNQKTIDIDDVEFTHGK